MIVVDALAARSAGRLGVTVQLSDTGIQPGSGVGNHRSGLTEETLGIPVFAIGIPIIWIAMDDYSGPETKEGLRGMYHSPQDVSAFSDLFCGSVSVTPTRDEKQEPAKSGLEAKRDACALSAAHLDSPNTEIPDGKNMERE